jgi:hypothetical protein
VVGVLPADFQPLPERLLEHGADIYRPLGKEFTDEIRSGQHLPAIAHLRPGAGIAQAQNQLTTISQRMQSAHSDANGKSNHPFLRSAAVSDAMAFRPTG